MLLLPRLFVVQFEDTMVHVPALHLGKDVLAVVPQRLAVLKELDVVGVLLLFLHPVR